MPTHTHDRGHRPWLHPIAARACRITVVLIALATCAQTLATQDHAEAITACRAITDSAKRVACYDCIPVHDDTGAHRWSGNNSTDTFALELSESAILVIRHTDAILVGTLRDKDGNTLENLHLAGAGTLRVSIRDPGKYQITVSATGAWTARLED